MRSLVFGGKCRRGRGYVGEAHSALCVVVGLPLRRFSSYLFTAFVSISFRFRFQVGLLWWLCCRVRMCFAGCGTLFASCVRSAVWPGSGSVCPAAFVAVELALVVVPSGCLCHEWCCLFGVENLPLFLAEKHMSVLSCELIDRDQICAAVGVN